MFNIKLYIYIHKKLIIDFNYKRNCQLANIQYQTYLMFGNKISEKIFA